jgi:hypothetical protein
MREKENRKSWRPKNEGRKERLKAFIDEKEAIRRRKPPLKTDYERSVDKSYVRRDNEGRWIVTSSKYLRRRREPPQTRTRRYLRRCRGPPQTRTTRYLIDIEDRHKHRANTCTHDRSD